MGRSLRTPSQSDDLPDPSLAVAGDDYFLAAAGDDSSLAAAGDDSFLAATGDDSSLAEAGGDSALPDVPSICRDLMSTAHRACKKADAADAQRDKERKEPNFEHKRRPPPPPKASAARRRSLPPPTLLTSHNSWHLEQHLEASARKARVDRGKSRKAKASVDSQVVERLQATSSPRPPRIPHCLSTTSPSSSNLF